MQVRGLEKVYHVPGSPTWNANIKNIGKAASAARNSNVVTSKFRWVGDTDVVSAGQAEL